ncbi:MAG: zinc ribbon domain-containing protein, partial [Proteobacteria bacterium]|nr:zinc ribbon domain-containing protein [Pseudomonadota bacterium]
MDTEGWIRPTEATQPFFDGAKLGVLRLQHCRTCDGSMYPIKTRCQHCGSTELDWQDSKGTGTVYAHAKLHRQYHPRHQGRLPLVIA